MSDKKAYDKQVKKNGKLASFLRVTPMSAAAQKKAGTQITDDSARMDARRPNALAKMKKGKGK